ncbi:MAG: TonB-dependent receptor [Steroidobacter sp.]
MSHRREKRARQAARVALMTAVSLEAMLVGPTVLADSQQTATASKSSDDLEELVVTGYRASLKSALDNKRNSNQAMESVVAEDVGKMPDQNVSEILQRLPGIQINRAGGKGTQVLIDGLANNLITLNGEVFLTGKEFYVSGEASGGGSGSNVQYASLEGIPSEEIGGIDVIKNPNANDREGGLGGIVNLKTRAPIASQTDGFNLAGNARVTKATDAEGGMTPQITLVGGYKAGDNFAFTGSVSYDDQKTHDKQYQAQNRAAWIITNTAQDGSYTGSPSASTLSTLPNNQTYIDPQFGYFSDILQEVKTTGITLGAEFKWSDNVSSTFNYFFTHEDDENVTYSVKVGFNGGGANNSATTPASFPGIDPAKPYSIDSNGVVQSATFMANGLETATLYQHTISNAHNYQFNTVFGGDGALTGDFGLAYAIAHSNLQADQADVEHGYYGGFGLTGSLAQNSSHQPTPGCNNYGASCDNGNHGLAFTWANGGTSGLPSAQYLDLYGYTNVLSNPDYTLFKSNWAWANLTDEKNAAIKGNLKYVVNDVLSLKAGVRFASRRVDQTFGRYLEDGSGNLGYDPAGGTNYVGAGTAAGNCCVSPPTTDTWLYYLDPGYAAIPFSTALSNPELVKDYNNFAVGTIAVKNVDTGGMRNPSTYLNTLWNQANGAKGPTNNSETFFKDTLSSFTVREDTSSAYVMGDAGGAGDVYHADFGIRVVRTHLTVDGGQTNKSPTYWGTASWNGVNKNNDAFEKSRSYVDVLPSFNFVLNATEDQKIRFGAARVLAPQNLMQLGLGNSYNFTRGADGPGGQARFFFVNGASGNPNLDPFRASQFLLSWEDYFAESGLVSVGYFYKAVDNFVTNANIPTTVADDFGGSTGNVTTPVNGGRGKIYGVELNAQYAFSSGFGFQFNYTRSNSETDASTAFAANLPIPGVSKDSINLTGYFERAGFSARLAYAWRSEALNSSLVGSTFSFQDFHGNQVVYPVYAAAYGQLDGQIGYDFSKNFGVLASVSNLTNAKQHTYLQWSNQPFTYDDSGRRFFIGIKGKL